MGDLTLSTTMMLPSSRASMGSTIHYGKAKNRMEENRRNNRLAAIGTPQEHRDVPLLNRDDVFDPINERIRVIVHMSPTMVVAIRLLTDSSVGEG